MTISKRDTIIIAVLVNVGLLAILFMTALQFDEDSIQHTSVSTDLAFQEAPTPSKEEGYTSPGIVSSTISPASSSKKENHETLPKVPLQESLPSFSSHEEVKVAKERPYIEVTVKKGDMLEKIARANGVTVEEIKTLNHLNSDRLNIGQVLKIPVSSSKVPSSSKPKSGEAASSEVVYHMIKSGDNPWKVARQYNVKYEDILKLNGLNEEKARNLKIGDKIRVK